MANFSFLSYPSEFSSDFGFLKFKKFNCGKKMLLSKKIEMNDQSTIEKINNQSEWIKSILRKKKKEHPKYIDNLQKIGINLLKNTKFPSKNDESWRFTKLDKLFDMKFSREFSKVDSEFSKKYLFEKSSGNCIVINEILVEDKSKKYTEKDKFFLGKLSDLSEPKKKKIMEITGKGESGINGGFFSILNMASIEEIIVLYISEGTEIDLPIQILFGASVKNEEVCLNQKLIILCEKGSKATIFQQHVGSKGSKFFDNTTTDILLEENSKIDFFLINQVPEKASCFNSIYSDVKKGATFNFFSFCFGGMLSRISLGIDLNGINSTCNVEGISVVNKSKISDIHSRISHNYPFCNSSQLQKNLISDKGHSIFAGKIQVHNGAMGTESSQLCKSLLLSPTSKVDSMPILEINNEDVKCTHGSTVSDLDDEQLFYFKSRGIPVENARFLLTLGFVSESLRKLPEELITSFSGLIKKLIENKIDI